MWMASGLGISLASGRNIPMVECLVWEHIQGEAVFAHVCLAV